MLRNETSGRGRTGRRAVLALLQMALMAGVPALAAAAQIELVSRAPFRRAPDTAGGVNDSLGRSSLSADGRYFVYSSSAPNLAPGQADVNAGEDVFLYDRLLGTTTLVSHAAGSASRTGDDRSDVPVISADGSYVAFASLARDLVPGLEDNPAGRKHVFLYERASGKITLVSHRAGRSGKAANGFSDNPLLSADGSYVGYDSLAMDLVPGQIPLLGPNVFLYERASGTTTLVSRRGSSAQQPANGPSGLSALSADGRYLAFFSYATDHVPGQNDANRTMDVFLYDRLAGAATLVSHALGSALTTGNGPSGSPSLSADGRYLAFSSGATDLVSGITDDNRRADVFLYDRLVGTVSLVSRSAGSPNAVNPQGGFEPIISQDGGTIAYFDEDPDFVLNSFQLLVFDRLAGSTAVVFQSPPVSAEFPPPRDFVALSGNGRYVVFTSLAEDLVSGQDGGGFHDVFLLDRASGATVLVSHANGLPKKAGNGDSFAATISADGSWIAFVSGASDLEAGKRDSNAAPDVFLHETATAVNRTVSLHPPGMASLTPMGSSRVPSISGDGRYVAFASFAAGLFPGHVDSNSASDVFLYDRISKTTVLVSRSSASPAASANAGSEAPMISRDGNYILFASRATNLVAGQRDSVGTFDIFLYDRRAGTNILVSRSLDSPLQTASGTSSVGGLSADGSVVAFTSLATDLVRETDSNAIYDVFWFDRRTRTVTLASRTRPSPAGRAGNNSSFFSSMSPDGAFIAFSSAASDLVPGVQDANGEGDAFVYERRSGKVALLSRAGGTSGPAAGGELPVVSADGRYAAYISRTRSVVLLDRVSGKAVQAGPDPVSPGTSPGLSDDGRHVLFSSDRADVIPGQDDRNEQSDLFLFDRVSGQTSLVSHVPGLPLRAGERGGAFQGRLSADGRFAVFFSLAPDLQPGAPRLVPNVFLYDRTSRDVTLVSRSALSPSPRGGNGGSLEPVISAQGGFVAFASFASDLVTGDFNGSNPDVFLYLPGI